MIDRELDLVLFGATGYVGRLTADHLARHAPDGVRIGLAGRSAAKVERTRDRLGVRAQDWPIVVADAADPESLRTMAERASVVVSTVGPYATYGMPLVTACAETGTDYVDLTGEVLFVRRSIDQVQHQAEQTGARIVHSCGFDSVPSDLAVLMAADRAAEDGAGELTDTTTYATLKGGFSGGTVASARQQVEEITRDPSLKRVVLDKFALSPDRGNEPQGEFKDSVAVRYAEEARSWVAPFIMATYNTRVVRRSNALLGHRYGRAFRYREVMRTGDGAVGSATAYAIAAGLGAGVAAMSLPFLSPLVDKMVPAPGEGPSGRNRDRGFFRMDCYTSTTDGSRYRSTVAAQGDPGYAATSIMLGESALALALERDRCPLPPGTNGGVLTPATALGSVLVERLRQHGFTCDVRKL